MARQTIGEFLQTQRKAHGLTQQEVADRLGISNRTLSAWETDRAYPDILALPELADLYGVTTDEILRGERIAQTEQSAATPSPKRERAALKRRLASFLSVSYGLLALFCAGCLLLFLSALGFVNFFTVLSGVLGVIAVLFALVLRIPVYQKAVLCADDEETDEQKRYIQRLTNTNLRAVFIQNLVAAGFALILWLYIILAFGDIFMLFTILCASFFILLAAVGAIITWIKKDRAVQRYENGDALARHRKDRKRLKACVISALCGITVLSTVGIWMAVSSISSFRKEYSGTKEEVVAYLHTVEVPVGSELNTKFGIVAGTYVLDLSSLYRQTSKISIPTENGIHCFGNSQEVQLSVKGDDGFGIGLCNADAVCDESGETVAYCVKPNLPEEYGGNPHALVYDGWITYNRIGYEIRTENGNYVVGEVVQYYLERLAKLVFLVGFIVPPAVAVAVYLVGRKKKA